MGSEEGGERREEEEEKVEYKLMFERLQTGPLYMYIYCWAPIGVTLDSSLTLPPAQRR